MLRRRLGCVFACGGIQVQSGRNCPVVHFLLLTSSHASLNGPAQVLRGGCPDLAQNRARPMINGMSSAQLLMWNRSGDAFRNRNKTGCFLVFTNRFEAVVFILAGSGIPQGWPWLRGLSQSGQWFGCSQEQARFAMDLAGDRSGFKRELAWLCRLDVKAKSSLPAEI